MFPVHRNYSDRIVMVRSKVSGKKLKRFIFGGIIEIADMDEILYY